MHILSKMKFGKRSRDVLYIFLKSLTSTPLLEESVHRNHILQLYISSLFLLIIGLAIAIINIIIIIVIIIVYAYCHCYRY